MPQHFLLSAKARSLSIAQVLSMPEADVETTIAQIRWPETNGKPVCPSCGCPICYDARRPTGAPRFRCKACRADFSITSGTLFASHKLSLRSYLVASLLGGICGWFDEVSAHPCGRSLVGSPSIPCFKLPR